MMSPEYCVVAFVLTGLDDARERFRVRKSYALDETSAPRWRFRGPCRDIIRDARSGSHLASHAPALPGPQAFTEALHA
jgi:hypothetical protein